MIDRLQGLPARRRVRLAFHLLHLAIVAALLMFAVRG